jgi:hypothetical protein
MGKVLPKSIYQCLSSESCMELRPLEHKAGVSGDAPVILVACCECVVSSRSPHGNIPSFTNPTHLISLRHARAAGPRTRSGARGRCRWRPGRCCAPPRPRRQLRGCRPSRSPARCRSCTCPTRSWAYRPVKVQALTRQAPLQAGPDGGCTFGAGDAHVPRLAAVQAASANSLAGIQAGRKGAGGGSGGCTAQEPGAVAEARGAADGTGFELCRPAIFAWICYSNLECNGERPS